MVERSMEVMRKKNSEGLQTELRKQIRCHDTLIPTAKPKRS